MTIALRFFVDLTSLSISREPRTLHVLQLSLELLRSCLTALQLQPYMTTLTNEAVVAEVSRAYRRLLSSLRPLGRN